MAKELPSFTLPKRKEKRASAADSSTDERAFDLPSFFIMVRLLLSFFFHLWRASVFVCVSGCDEVVGGGVWRCFLLPVGAVPSFLVYFCFRAVKSIISGVLISFALFFFLRIAWTLLHLCN
jgi:hypothetical protein